MSADAQTYGCRDPDCEARFLTVDARNGHEQVHAAEHRREHIIGVTTP